MVIIFPIKSYLSLLFFTRPRIPLITFFLAPTNYSSPQLLTTKGIKRKWGWAPYLAFPPFPLAPAQRG